MAKLKSTRIYGDLIVDNQLTIGSSDVTAGKIVNWNAAYTHSQQPHAPSDAQKNSDITKAEIEAKLIGEITTHSHALPTHNHDDTYYTETEIDTKLSNLSVEGHTHVIGDITNLQTTLNAKADLVNGLIDSNQLPSYVDDVIEATSVSNFPTTGEAGKIYVNTTNNLTYRWSGTQYVEISKSLALGETSSTAYAGNKGKAVTDDLASHKSNKSNPHEVTKTQVGLGNVDNTSDVNKPVSTAQQAALDDKVDKETGKGLSTNDLTNALKSNYDAAYTHSTATHAPSNAQKNSDITKAEIEAKLEGEITSHSHALLAHNHDDKYYTETEVDTKLAGKANTSHNHNDTYYTETEVDTKLAGKLGASSKAVDSDKLDGNDSSYYASTQYVSSRGQNLVTNGSAILGNNFNFSNFTFDGSESYYSGGSFRYKKPDNGGTSTSTDEFMPVNPELRYKLDLFAKTSLGTGYYYFYLAFYDVDGRSIAASNHMYRENTLTTLAQDLKPGDTVMHLTDASDWYNSGVAGVSTHLRSLIIWDYKNSFGYQYPPETYSRYYTGNAWNPGSINFSTNTITLRVPWSGRTVPAGTYISNGSSGGTYKYLWSGYHTTNWENYSGIIEGVDLSGTNAGNKFPPGTAKTKIGWLMDYHEVGDTAWYTNISFGVDYSKEGHTHTKSEITDFPAIPTVTNDLTDALKSNYDAAYTHSTQPHAPSSAEANVQSDWNQTVNTADDFIKNKPTIPTVTNDLTDALKSNYDAAYTHSTQPHAPSSAEANVQSDWNQTVNTADDFIKNKPTIPTVTNDLTNALKSNYDAAYTHSTQPHAPSSAEANVQSDWNQTVNTADDFIKNKPTIPTVTNDLTNALKSNYDAAYTHSTQPHAPSSAEANVQSDWNQTVNTADDFIKNKPTIPSKTSDLTNDSGFATETYVNNKVSAIETTIAGIEDLLEAI